MNAENQFEDVTPADLVQMKAYIDAGRKLDTPFDYVIEGKTAGISFEEQIQSAERGCDRAASVFNQELKKGLSALATIATSAPFIGLFGTISGIINAFRGMALTGSGGIGAVAGGIAEALVTTAFGIGVAIIALWCFNTLNTKIEVFDAEMNNTTSQVVDFFMRAAVSK